MERIDSHQHFWKYDAAKHDWIGDDMSVIRKDFLPVDLAPLLEENGFSGAVAVQADQSIGETMFLLELAEKYSFLCGVVGWVDLRSDELEKELDALQKFDKLKGVRHILQSEPDDALMLKPAFKRGIEMLAAYSLTYDILVFPHHLKHVDEFVSFFPYQPFVIDHLAKPYIRTGDIAGWAADIAVVAKYPNVMCKISGMVTEADWESWTAADLRPYMDVVLEAFGPARLMFGSDWPVCLVASDYAGVFNSVNEYIQTLSGAEQAAILGGNAKSFYKLI